MSLARLGLLDGYEGDIDTTRRFSESEMLFDDILCEAVKAFQQSRGIMPTGAIDDSTLRELREASYTCLLYTSPSPRDRQKSRMPSSA